MKKILSFLTAFLIIIGTSFLAHADNIITLAYEGAKPTYAPTSKNLWGGSLKFFSAGRSYYVDVQAAIMKKSFLAGIEKFQKNYLTAKAEYNCWGPIVIQFSHVSTAEFYDLFCWDERNNPIMSENWRKKELKCGLGLMLGSYNKSFIRFLVDVGLLWRTNQLRLPFLDVNCQNDKFQSMIAGGNLRIRIKPRFNIGSVKIPFWSDLENDCYWIKTGGYYNKTCLSLGVQIFKYFGLQSGIEIVKLTNNRNYRLTNNYLGAIILF